MPRAATAEPQRGPLAGPLLTAFAASGAIMIIELTAGRLISRHLGMSLYTWTSIIAVMMAGMALGNAAGGYIADRYPPRRALAALFFVAAIASVLLLPINDLLGALAPLRGLSWPLRIFLHVTGLFLLPAIALGGIAPVVARLALSQGRAPGRTVGLIYASSVAGSIFCTFLTGYYLVLLLGVNAICLLASGLLAALAVLYLLAAFLSEDPAPAALARPTAMKRAVLAPWWPAILTVLASNFGFMALELGAARVLSRDYGNSVFTWTATIGVFLAGITLGNALGGWAADRDSSRRAVARYFLTAAVAVLVGPFFFRTVHEVFLRYEFLTHVSWGIRIAIVMATGFFIPCVFIGFISPIIVKRGLDEGRAPGRTVASVYAWGALGGVLGTLASGYWLIDRFGSLTVICGTAVLLALVALLYAPRRPLPIGGFAVALLVLYTAVAGTGGLAAKLGDRLHVRPVIYDDTIFHDESQYSFVAIRADRENPNIRTMILDKLEHSMIDFEHPADFKQEYEWMYEAIFESIFPSPNPLRSFFIGGGGFIYPRYFDVTRPGSHTEVAEIDPAVTEAAYDHFGLPRENHIDIHNMDARNRITTLIEQRAQDPASVPPFDLIVGDSFNDFSVPSHLTTLEFTRQVKDLLGENGIYVLNMIDMYDPGLFISAFLKTLREVFPNVYVFNSGAPPSVRDTFVIVCSEKPRALGRIPDIVRMGHPYSGHWLTPPALDALLARNAGPALTDNYAPTEMLLAPVVRRAYQDRGQEHFQYAVDAYSKGYTDKAIEECNLALDGHPGWSEVNELLGDLWTQKGLNDEALKAYQAALAFAPDPARIRYKIGSRQLEAGDLETGRDTLEAALKDDPDHVETLLKLAALIMDGPEVARAIPLMEHAVQLAPDNVNARYNLGYAYTLQSDFAKAVAQWEAGLVVDPSHTDSLENLLQGYIALKDFDKAFGVLKRYDALGTEPPADKLQQLVQESGRTE